MGHRHEGDDTDDDREIMWSLLLLAPFLIFYAWLRDGLVGYWKR